MIAAVITAILFFEPTTVTQIIITVEPSSQANEGWLLTHVGNH
jgi:hypothetical protein